ncbi:MAG: hypothetical protein C4576_30105 [Desulfobacteraceae bacterium]|nr:MAG: hypothetical protein C4576_30105 [Desulfobacteraceae bacterium]
MRKWKVLFFTSLAMAFAVLTWSPGLAPAQVIDSKEAGKRKVAKGVVKGKVTRDDVARYLGKVTPSEQKAAAKRAKKLGLKPGLAGVSDEKPRSDRSR